MPEEQVDPIPRDLAGAFDNAVGLYENWKWGPGQPELEVFCDAQRFSMSAVCGFVDKFTDPLPGYLVDRLLGYMDLTHDDFRRTLVNDPSYRTGSRCLLQLIERRRQEAR